MIKFEFSKSHQYIWQHSMEPRTSWDMLAQSRQRPACLSTGCPHLDLALGGGMRTGITERACICSRIAFRTMSSQSIVQSSDTRHSLFQMHDANLQFLARARRAKRSWSCSCCFKCSSPPRRVLVSYV
jgi:hypothetical protein